MSESLTWVKSSYSSTGNCVEVAGQPGRVLIRDTKDQPRLVLSISAAAWRRFTGQVKLSLAAVPVWDRSRTGVLLIAENPFTSSQSAEHARALFPAMSRRLSSAAVLYLCQ